MRFTTMLAIPVLLSSSLLSPAQKPYATGKANYARTTGKGTPASLSHHKDNSDAFLRENTRNTSASALNKLEQESLRAAGASSAVKPARVRPVGSPKLSPARTQRNVPINFSGKASGRGLTATNPKSGGKSSAASSPKPR